MGTDANSPTIEIGDNTDDMFELYGYIVDKAFPRIGRLSCFEDVVDTLYCSPIFKELISPENINNIDLSCGIQLNFPNRDNIVLPWTEKGGLVKSYIGPIDSSIWEPFSYVLAAVCSAGGTKLLVELLKAYVDERKGRKIRIKRGEFELEINGGTPQKQIEEIFCLFEAKFKKE